MIIEVLERYDVPDVPTLADLPTADGIPLESNWHRIQINLLIDIITQRWRYVRDFFAGGNMFVYYSMNQVRNRDYKGPDFFLVKDVDDHNRDAWVVWLEDARFPDVIVELMSPSTAREDLTTKKHLYERTFHTPEYYAYDPNTLTLYGWRLENMHYVELQPNAEGRLWSVELEGWVGLWRGTYLKVDAIWLRLFEEDGRLVPTEGEAGRQRAEAERQRAEAENQRAEAERQRAEAEKQRAEAAETETARLREELARLRGGHS